MKKILISMCLILLSAFCNLGFCTEPLTSNTYNFKDLNQVVMEMKTQEATLESYFSQKHSKKENSKRFSEYVLNMNALRENFFSAYNASDKSLDDDYYFSFDKALSDSYVSHFARPSIKSVYLYYYGGLTLSFDYAYILKQYCPHLDRAWKTYFEYKKEENADRLSLQDFDGEADFVKRYENTGKKWVKKWTLFTMLHPNFSLNDEIRTDISNEIKHHPETSFNFKIYLFSVIGIGLAILISIGAIICFIKKVALIDLLKRYVNNLATKLKTYTNNLIAKITCYCKLAFSLIMKHKKSSLITFAVIIISIIIILIHNANSIPKCDSKFAEETVIKIFKQHEMIYEKNIENVSEIKMSDFMPVSYDKGINKYTCSANLTMYSKPNNPIYFLGAYKSFKYNVYYEIYKERGKNTAKASWEMFNIGSQESAR